MCNSPKHQSLIRSWRSNLWRGTVSMHRVTGMSHLLHRQMLWLKKAPAPHGVAIGGRLAWGMRFVEQGLVNQPSMSLSPIRRLSCSVAPSHYGAISRHRSYVSIETWPSTPRPRGRSAINATTQTANPPSARPQPTHPVEVQPSPAAIARPPSQGPSAFAKLNAE
jgi:hypothetical protein